MPTIQELRLLQGLPLEVKIAKTKQRIREWVGHFGIDGVYVSFSGGKDSTVLLTIAREVFPEIKGMFIDTGLEFPEIRSFVKTWDNIDWIKPKLTFRQILDEYGYPFISKEVAECVWGARKYLSAILEQMDDAGENQKKPPYAQFYRKLTGGGEYRKPGGGRKQRNRCLFTDGNTHSELYVSEWHARSSNRQREGAAAPGDPVKAGQIDSGDSP